jgi:hypothetical protein
VCTLLDTPGKSLAFNAITLTSVIARLGRCRNLPMAIIRKAYFAQMSQS